MPEELVGLINMRKSIQKICCAGFSTLEMMIAMAILVIALTTVTVTMFGGDSMLIDTETSIEALARARMMVESAQTLSRKDFMLVNSTSSDETIGSVTYHKQLSVVQSSDHFTKRLLARVSWDGEHGRVAHVELPALVTNFNNASGGDTCDSVLSGNWALPITKNVVTDFLALTATSTGINVITNVDAYKGKLYVTVGNTNYKTDPTFFIFDIQKLKTDPTHALLAKLDTATTTTVGLFAPHVAEDGSGKTYAYVANEYNPNWNTCALNYNCAQLQIIDVSSSTKLTTASTTLLKIPNVLSTTGGAGNSIFYKNGLVYLGLTKTNSGNEFNIVDVHDPLHPQWIGSYPIGATVNAIKVVGTTAFLSTTDNTRELIVLNVENPVTPTLFASYDASGQANAGYGQSMALLGDTLFFGRTYVGNAPEFLVLDASNTKVTSPTLLGVRDIGPNATNPFTINAIVTRDSLTFLAGGSPSTGGKLFVLSTQDPSTMSDFATPVVLPNNSLGSAMDCEGNDLIVSSNNISNQGYLSVITATP